MLDDRFANALTAVVALTLVVSVAAAGGGVSLQQDDSQPSETQTAAQPQSQNTSYLRVAHVSPDAPRVNVTVGNQTVATNVDYGAVSEYMNVSAGTHNVTIAIADETAGTLFEGNVTVEPRTVSTLAVSGEFSAVSQTEIQPVMYQDDAWEPANETGAVRVAHLSPDAGAVDVVVTEGPSDQTAATETEVVGEETETETEAVGEETETETGTAEGTMTETETGTAEGTATETEAAEGDSSGIEADSSMQQDNETETETGTATETEMETETGTAEATETEMATAEPTETEALGTETAAAEQDVPRVLADDVSFRNVSEYVNVPAGNYTIEIREEAEDNNGSVIATVEVSVEGGQAQTVFAGGYAQTEDAPAGEEFGAFTVTDATQSVTLPERDTNVTGTATAGTETEAVGEETETEAVGEETETETGEETETETGEETETETGEETETETGEEETETETPAEETATETETEA